MFSENYICSCILIGSECIRIDCLGTEDQVHEVLWGAELRNVHLRPIAIGVVRTWISPLRCAIVIFFPVIAKLLVILALTDCSITVAPLDEYLYKLATLGHGVE